MGSRLFRSAQSRRGVRIFAAEAAYEFGDEGTGFARADALAGAADVAPSLRLRTRRRIEVHRLDVALRQVVGIEARVDDRAPEVIAVDAGEEGGGARCR